MDRDRRAAERAASGGDVEARARVLLSRVRAGELAADRLELAAYAGDEAAVLAGGLASWASPGVDPRQRPLREWVEGLSAWGVLPAANQVSTLAQVAAALGAAQFVVERDRWGTESTAVLGAIRRWLVDPSEAMTRTWHQATIRVRYVDPIVSAGLLPEPDWAGCERGCGPWPQYSRTWARAPGRIHEAFRLTPREDHAELRAAVERSVAAWALGEAPFGVGR